MPKLQLSNEEISNIISDYNNGMTITNVAKKYKHDRQTLKKYFQDHNIEINFRSRSESLRLANVNKSKRLYPVNDNYFSVQNHKMAYILGFLMADGKVSKQDNRIQICLAEKDSDYLNLFYIFNACLL